jgi:hypothetical protein
MDSAPVSRTMGWSVTVDASGNALGPGLAFAVRGGSMGESKNEKRMARLVG